MVNFISVNFSSIKEKYPFFESILSNKTNVKIVRIVLGVFSLIALTSISHKIWKRLKNEKFKALLKESDPDLVVKKIDFFPAHGLLPIKLCKIKTSTGEKINLEFENGVMIKKWKSVQTEKDHEIEKLNDNFDQVIKKSKLIYDSSSTKNALEKLKVKFMEWYNPLLNPNPSSKHYLYIDQDKKEVILQVEMNKIVTTYPNAKFSIDAKGSID